MSAASLSEHHSYLQDDARNRAYAAALAQVVTPGAHVLDLGCGTGVLGLLALAAGAGEVDAVDSSPMIEVAREMAEANGRAGQVRHHQVWSTNLQLDRRVDLVICDQTDGIFGVQCGLLDAVADARDRLAAPGATLVPAAVTPLLVPVHVPELRAQLDTMSRSSTGLDTEAMARRSRNTVWYVSPKAIEGAGPELAGDVVSLAGPPEGPVVVGGALPAPPAGAAPWDGLLLGFRVELASGVTCSNVPGAPDVIDRGGPILPFVDGEAPSRVDVRLYPRSGVLRWRMATAAGEVDRSTLGGLLDPVLQTRLDPGRTPSPSEAGALVAGLLAAADGTRTAQELRAGLPEQHRELVDALLSDGYLA